MMPSPVLSCKAYFFSDTQTERSQNVSNQTGCGRTAKSTKALGHAKSSWRSYLHRLTRCRSRPRNGIVTIATFTSIVDDLFAGNATSPPRKMGRMVTEKQGHQQIQTTCVASCIYFQLTACTHPKTRLLRVNLPAKQKREQPSHLDAAVTYPQAVDMVGVSVLDPSLQLTVSPRLSGKPK